MLFGLGTIQFARNPEGIIEARKRKAALKASERAEARARKRAAPEVAVAPRVEEPVG